MADESFYGATLSGADSKITWEVGYNEEEMAPHEQKLIIKQILLGAEAKPDEFNVVEVQTTKDSVKIPIAVLKAGETRALYPKIEFFDSSVTFKLIKGSGPVYLHGQVIKDVVEVVDWEGDESDEDDDEDEEDEQPKKKQKVENNSTNAKHKKK